MVGKNKKRSVSNENCIRARPFHAHRARFSSPTSLWSKNFAEINVFKDQFLENPENFESLNVEVEKQADDIPDWVKSKRIEQYEWSVRTKNVFDRLGIEVVSDLLAYKRSRIAETTEFWPEVSQRGLRLQGKNSC